MACTSTKESAPSDAQSESRAPIAAIDAAPLTVSPGCVQPKDLLRLSATDPVALRELAAQRTPRSSQDSHGPRSDGLAFVLLQDPHMHVVVTKDAKNIASVDLTLPAGGGVDARLSATGRYVVTEYTRRGPELVPIAGGPRTGLSYGGILSPDDTYALEPASVHPFTMEFEHGRHVSKVELPSGKRHAVAEIPESALPAKSDDEKVRVNQASGVAICATGAVYAVSHGRALTIYRAKDDAVLASAPNPGPGVPVFTEDGRYVVVGGVVFRLV